MTFPFIFICELLSQLEDQHRNGASGPSRDAILTRWFKKHRARLDHPSTDLVAIFSTLLPEKRIDRVYGIGPPRLAQIIGRACCLGVTRRAVLSAYEQPGHGDLADSVKKVISEAPNPRYNPQRLVTVEEIDALLDALASNSRFSSEAVRSRRSVKKPICHDDVGHFFLRLCPVESTWFTRLVLKQYGGASLDDRIVYRAYDPRISNVLRIQDNFEVALRSLRQLRNAQPLGLGDVLKQIKPKLGTKVGRQTWLKGRSIKDCFDMSPGRISCEKKMDGEYCQIHVDMKKPYPNIQIFSKSGKDSTEDRRGLHRAIREALRLGSEKQAISTGCILEGELVVYNDRNHKIMPFDVIRKYVSRSGVFIGTEQDSPRDPDEHLMIVFFDALLIDDESLLGLRQTKRFERLEQLISRRPGHAELVQRQIIDLDRHLGVSHLRKALAKSIVNREEGLVLKPDEPYFHFGRQAERKHPSCPIKVKKDYFKGLGDIGDFAVVGARYDAVHAKSYKIPGLKWTKFFLGCLKNKDAMLLHQEKPMFVVIESVELNPTQLKNFIHFVNPNSVELDEQDAFELIIPKRFSGSKGISVVFTTPPVFDISCFSFSLEGNTGFHTPRFPQVTKIHYERDFMDTVTFDELMSMAEKARTLAAPDDSQEMLEWMATLEAADPRGRAVDAASQSTAWSGFTPSPRSCSTRQSTSQQLLSGSPTRPERIHSIQYATARPESVPVQSPAPAPLLWGPGPAGRPTTARNPAAPSLPPRAGQVAGDFSAPGNLKRSSPSPSTTTTVENKRLRTQPLEKSPPLSTTSPPAIKQTAIMATSTGNQSIPANQVLPPPQGAADPAVDDDDGPSILDQLAAGDSADEDFFEIDEDTVDDEPAAPSIPPFLPGRCRYLGGRCSMPGRSVLLSPCVKDHLLVTQTLLPSHGITEWITDPREWAQNAAQGIVVQAGTPPREADDDNLAAQPLPQPRPRSKICFVECRHTQETRDFVDKIEALELTLADGGHDWVEIFDWRALEVMLVIEEDMYEGKAVPENPAGDVYKYFCGLA